MEPEYFMREALNLAKLAADDGEVPVGAVVVKGDEIVGRGYNRREGKKNALAHAEIAAINDACKNLSGWRLWQCDLYVTLEPCPMCAGAIVNSRIKKVYFGAKDEKAGCFGSVIDFNELPFNHKPEIEGGILASDCKDLLSSFFSKLRENK